MDPPAPEQLLDRALAHHQRNELAQAEALYRQVLARDPNQHDALHLLGMLAHATGHSEAAVQMISRAIAIRPGTSLFHRSLCAPLQALRRFEQAIEHWKIIGQLEPQATDAPAQVGALTLVLGNAPESVAWLERAAALNPFDPGIQSNLGSAYAVAGRIQDSLNALRRSVELQPQVAQAHHNLAVSLRQSALVEEAEHEFRQAIRLSPDYPAAGSGMLLTLHYRTHDRATVYREHRNWEQRIVANIPRATVHRNDPSPDRRLRVGYVSGDFRLHSAGLFIEPLITAHDPATVEIFCYSGTSHPDDVTRRIRASAHAWRDIAGVSDEQLAQNILSDGIDILVDLAGHTAGERLRTFARKPAPIQLSYLGYPDTTGLCAMDYRVTDIWADPPQRAADDDPFYVEQLIRLNRCAWCYRPPDAAPEVDRSARADADSITFGSFNNLAKLSPEIIAVWADLLRAVPASRLLLKSRGLEDASIRHRFVEAFTSHGIDASRLLFEGHVSSLRDHLAAYNRISVALDTFPYHGTTTTCDALWMGVPVVTLSGDRHVSRVGASLLHAVELDDLVAPAPADFIHAAAELARDHHRLTLLHDSLRDRMRNAPLTDGPSLARAVEAAYRTLWRRWCDQRQKAGGAR
ncbi:MAG TPA: tetratricopeptide repeat protein [Tepidisphaeraceae bacterium]